MERRPKVVVLQFAPAPYREPLFAGLARRVDLEVVFCREADPARLWSRAGAFPFPHRVLHARVLRLGGRPVTVPYAVTRYLRSTCWDVVVVCDELRSLWAGHAAAAAARAAGRAFVVWSGEFQSPGRRAMYPPLLWRVVERLRGPLYRGASAVLAYGPKTAQHLRLRHGVPAQRIRWGTQPVLPLRLPGRGPGGGTRVLYLGYLVPRKGVDTLIRAVRSLDRPDISLTVAGDGPERQRLQRVAAGDPRITFAGYVEGEAKLRLLAGADLFVSPTAHDPWANSVNEAVAAGLPVITTPAEGAEGTLVRHGENGLVVEPGRPAALAAALERLLDDGETRRRMAARSRALAAQFGLDWAVGNVLDAIDCALAIPPGPQEVQAA